ncbi:bifunctional 4-hydroxy-2-oxoglutarate aldolase/2-dehydro-3-deoxy-phosphogluconate aldolase [Myxococcota bacterium]|nr:bifunctional 4-hydroxy-2-oxoglutarate aldolase/2-dehydro-3-deoxy-phosphogluconate aldolase [Myxococcota bacterium]
MSITVDELVDAATVIPVLTVSRLEDAVPLARALKAGGLQVIEITWRTDAALDALTAMKTAEPDLWIGMGTIRQPAQVESALDAGADFLVSPGLTRELEAKFQAAPCPVLPGVATPSEAMQAANAGFSILKFFPAEQAGGLDYLKSLKGPLTEIRFCPTGSITQALAPDYLVLPNVACVGGSWIATSALIDAQDWDAITQNAAAAADMKS